MNTPWGTSDSKTTLGRGVSWVGTPSHGGFMVTKIAANKLLSPAAIKRGREFGSYLAFEEDCDFAIVMLELPTELLARLDGIPSREKLIEGLSRWHADYLIETGVEPTPEGLKFFNLNRLEQRMREDKSPDLIVAAFGDHTSWVEPGTVGVITADDSKWLVKADEYDSRRNLNLLSTYSLVKAVQ